MAISLGVRHLMVYGDSDLLVNQVMKEWDVRSPTMTGYCNAVRKLEKKFEGLELHHIPRLKIGKDRFQERSHSQWCVFGTCPRVVGSRGPFHRRSPAAKKCHGSD